MPTVGRIYDALVRASADRATTIVAVGGGVVGDIAGFAAATYLRGVPVVQVPTTLLAQVDSAIGGKVGVNHAARQEPDRRLSPAGCRASSIPSCWRRCRAASSAPASTKSSSTASSRAGRCSSASPRPVRSSSRAIRGARAGHRRVLPHQGRVSSRDERESGPRRALNFGHTLGHALEAVTKYRRFRHGEAVGYGMLAAANLAVARGVMPAADRDALAALIAQMGPLPAVADLSAQQVVDAIARDKKVDRREAALRAADGDRLDDDGDRRHGRRADCRGARPWPAGLRSGARYSSPVFLELREEHLVADLQELGGPALDVRRLPSSRLDLDALDDGLSAPGGVQSACPEDRARPEDSPVRFRLPPRRTTGSGAAAGSCRPR